MRLGRKTGFGRNARGGRVMWNPLAYFGSSLVGWFDPSDVNSCTNSGGFLQTITNKATGVVWNTALSVLPGYSPGGLSGMSCMTFNGTSQAISSTTDTTLISALNGDTSHTFFGVAQAATTGTARMFFGVADSVASGYKSWGQTNSNWAIVGQTAAGVVTTRTGTVASSTAASVMESWAPTTTTVSNQINGVSDFVGGAMALDVTTFNRAAIGCRPRSTPDVRWSGNVGEILVFNRTLTAFERSLVRIYLTGKWLRQETTPLTILGSAGVWYRADQGITLATGVSQWNDFSGNGRHLTQGTTANQPAFIPNAINGQPSVQGDGSNDVLTATLPRAAPGTQPFYVWSVMKQISWTLNDWLWADGSSGGGSTAGLRARGTTPELDLYNAVHAAANTTGAPIGSWVRQEAQFSNNTTDYLKLGSVVATGNPGNLAGSGTLALFSATNNVGPANVEIAEFFWFFGTPDAGQRAALDAYAYLRYGLALLI